MAAQIIDGKAIAEQVREEIKAQVAHLATCGVKPGVATILVGEDGGAQFYRGQIEKNTGTVGFNYYNHTLPAGSSEAEILDLIAKLNADAHVHGILALMPMDAQIDQNTVFNAIAPEPPYSRADYFEAICSAVAPAGTSLEWVDSAWLVEKGVTAEQLALWSGSDDPDWLFAMDPARALAAGLRTRPLAESAVDTAQWIERVGVHAATRGMGLAPDREEALLSAWASR